MADDIKKLWDRDSGKGFESMEGQDLMVPFLYICQANSPQLLPGNQLYIEAARPGNIFNSQTGEVWKEITVVVLQYAFRRVEWKARESGGGWVASYQRGQGPNDIVVDPATNRLHRPNGNVIVDTSYYLVKVKEDGWRRAILPMYSTQLKHGRRWNSVMLTSHGNSGKIPPIYAFMYRLSTVQEKNSKGVWFGWKIDTAGEVDDIVLYNASAEESEKQVNFLPERLIALVNGGSDDKDVM